jgi:transcriptional regulator with GAF, ATPase, and Fis domain
MGKWDGETDVRPPTAFDVQRRQQMPRITWHDGQQQRSVVVTRRMVIGSAPNADICVPDPLVSRVHAEIDLRSDGAWVHDLGSRNGTTVGELRVGSARLANGTRLHVGMTDLWVSYDTGETQLVDVWKQTRFGRLLGASQTMRELFALLHRIAATDVSVMIEGETGTGKELVAQAIHEHSPRAAKPFVIVDCAALPEKLIDAELFGHAKGAFTGAAGARAGAFEDADGGTVFLDEVGELPLETQPKLLRALEARTIRRIGETHHRNIDVRVIAATHRDLLGMVGRGEFREDLYFRLSVVPVRLPSLRQRREDIPLLVKHFVGEPEASRIEPRVLAALSERAWRGNVRELRNVVQRAIALGSMDALAAAAEEPSSTSSMQVAAVPVSVPPPPALAPASDDQLYELDYRSFRDQWSETGEREYVRRLLARHGNNVTAAARAAGVDRTYVHRLIKRLGL